MALGLLRAGAGDVNKRERSRSLARPIGSIARGSKSGWHALELPAGSSEGCAEVMLLAQSFTDGSDVPYIARPGYDVQSVK